MPSSRTFAPCCALVVAALSASLTGCSSSSSGGGSANPALTEPAAHSETFHNVSARANHLLQGSLPVMRGVASSTYQGGNLVVTFSPSAKKIDQTNVENIVRQSKHRGKTQPKKTQPNRKPSPSPSST